MCISIICGSSPVTNTGKNFIKTKNMTISISVFVAVLILLGVNIILEHLMNWWIRQVFPNPVYGDGLIVFIVIVWVAKTAVLIGLLYNMLN